MAVIKLPAVDPAEVRAAAGFHPNATWYSPRRKRPTAFKAQHGEADAQLKARS